MRTWSSFFDGLLIGGILNLFGRTVATVGGVRPNVESSCVAFSSHSASPQGLFGSREPEWVSPAPNAALLGAKKPELWQNRCKAILRQGVPITGAPEAESFEGKGFAEKRSAASSSRLCAALPAEVGLIPQTELKQATTRAAPSPQASRRRPESVPCWWLRNRAMRLRSADWPVIEGASRCGWVLKESRVSTYSLGAVP